MCDDTGSISQDIDDFLNCTACDAAERRMEMQNYISGLSPNMSNWAKCWAAYNFGMLRPVAAKPSRTELGDDLLAALEALQVGCEESSWIGWENGDGEEVGTRLQAAIDAYKAAHSAEVSAAPFVEVNP